MGSIIVQEPGFDRVPEASPESTNLQLFAHSSEPVVHQITRNQKRVRPFRVTIQQNNLAWRRGGEEFVRQHIWMTMSGPGLSPVVRIVLRPGIEIGASEK